MTTVYVLHKTGAPHHYLALQFLCDREGIEIVYYEYSIIKPLLRALYRPSKISNLRKLYVNLRFLCVSLVTGLSDKVVVVGIPPYDWRVIFIRLMLRNSNYFFHSSWPYWDNKNTPCRRFSLLNSVWSNFVSTSRGGFVVTDAVKKSISRAYPLLKLNLTTVYHCYHRDYELRKLPVASGEFSVAFLGRVEQAKGIDLVVRLAELFPHIQFHIVGAVTFEVRPMDNVKYYGKILDKNVIQRVLLKCTFLLLPSIKSDRWEELFGIAIIEGLASGLVPVITNNVGPKELVGLTCGYVFEQSEYVQRTSHLFEKWLNGDLVDLRESAFQHSKRFNESAVSRHWSPLIVEL